MQDRGTIDLLKSKMQSRHEIKPERVSIAQCPYRICPLGAHIDHQLGIVTAMAVDQGVRLAYANSGSTEVMLSSLSFDGQVRFNLEDIPPKIQGDWGNYPRGAAAVLRKSRLINNGIIGITSGSLSGCGLGSSASIGLAYLLGFEDVNGLDISRFENIRLDQALENEYLGLNNGILDQSAVLFSKKDHLTVIDCRAFAESSACEEPSKPHHASRLVAKARSMPSFVILIVFSGVTQAVVSTPYNLRVNECAQAAAKLLQAAGRPDQAPVLGNVSDEEYSAFSQILSGPSALRAAHFFSEMRRVRQGTTAWQRGDLEAFGQLMTESGWSSIRNYECGTQPLIDLFNILAKTGGVYGARFSGAGFRGCCVALADPAAASEAASSIVKTYAAVHPELAKKASVCVCQPDDGPKIL